MSPPHPTKYRFSFGPWNISTGADPFGPPVRKEMEFARKLKAYKELGFDAVQFHDDDIVPADLDWPSTLKGVAEVKKILDGEGLFVEIIAPRLWEDPRTIDGAFTSNSPADRKYALDRAKRCVDIAREVGCKNYVLWLAREGTLHPRGQGRQDRRRPDRRRLERDPRARQGDPHPRRGQAERADGPGLSADRRPHDRRRLQDDRPQPLGRPDRERPLDPRRPRPGRRHGLRPLSRQALERPPQRPERPEVRPGQGLRLGRPAPGVQPGLDPREERLRPNGECVGLDVKAMRTTTFEESMYPPRRTRRPCSSACSTSSAASTARRSRSSAPIASTSSSRC